MSATDEGWYSPPIPPPPGGSGPAIPEPPTRGGRAGLVSLAFVLVAAAAGGTGLIIGRTTAPEGPAPTAPPVISASPTSAFADDEQDKVSVQQGRVTSPEVTFSYPQAWVQAASSSTQTYPGLVRWVVRLEPEAGGNYVVVYAFNSSFDGTALLDRDAKAITTSQVNDFIAGVRGTMVIEPQLEHLGSESFWDWQVDWTYQDTPFHVKQYISFHRHLNIEVQCEWDDAHAQPMMDGCNQVLRTLDITVE